jgi:hypothetical protein
VTEGCIVDTKSFVPIAIYIPSLVCFLPVEVNLVGNHADFLNRMIGASAVNAEVLDKMEILQG